MGPISLSLALKVANNLLGAVPAMGLRSLSLALKVARNLLVAVRFGV